MRDLHLPRPLVTEGDLLAFLERRLSLAPQLNEDGSLSVSAVVILDDVGGTNSPVPGTASMRYRIGALTLVEGT